MTSTRATEMHERAMEILRTEGASDDAREAAVKCIELAGAFLEEREEVHRLNADRKRLRQRARAGFLRRARELTAETVPPALREFAGRLVDVPVPCTGHPLIYFLLEGDQVVYVGQTTSIETRLAQHVGLHKAFDRVLAMPVPAADLGAVERTLICQLLPALNTTHLPLAEARRRRAARDGRGEERVRCPC